MANYTVVQLLYFLEVAQRGQLSAAAEALFVSQSSLSKTIKKLETDIGVSLFERSRTGMYLTAQGEYLYNCFKAGLSQFDAAIEHAKRMQNDAQAVLRVGFFLTSSYLRDFDQPRRIIKEYKKRYPDVHVIEEYMTYQELREGLNSGKLDLIFSIDSALSNMYQTHVRRLKIASWEVVMSTKHPMAIAGRLDISALSKETFFFLSSGETQVDPSMNIERCKQIGFTPARELVVQNSIALREQVKQGMGMFLSVGGMISDEDTVAFELPQLPNSPYISAAWRDGRRFKPLDKLVAMLSENTDVF